MRKWQSITIGTLFTGYAGYYICRSNLSVANPLLLEEFGPALTKSKLGDIATAGVFLYAVGKTLNGIATEYIGGKKMFVIGMFASVLFTLLFMFGVAALPDKATQAGEAVPGSELVLAILPLYFLWGANRFVQSMGWGGLVQVVSRWFTVDRMATIMGILTLSYLFGDALARGYLGIVVQLGGGWRSVFLASAGALFIIGVINLFVLKNRPGAVGLPELPPPPGNVYGNDDGLKRIPLLQLLIPLLTNLTFWLVCLMNVGLTLIRETFNLWNPTYLKEVAKLSSGVAGISSLIFPLMGGFAAVSAGWLVDRSGGRYGLVVIPSLIGLALTLFLFTFLPVGELPDNVREVVALTMISIVAICLMAPYSFCSGVLAVRIGGQRGGASSAGIIDTAGYLGATLAGSGIGRLADSYGWSAVFGSLAAVTAVTLWIAVYYTWHTTPKSTE